MMHANCGLGRIGRTQKEALIENLRDYGLQEAWIRKGTDGGPCDRDALEKTT